ncbi:MAG: DNA polymerase III subunit gamma/tau [Clostridia bacterium]|nr:DNA polymerase III subunit gamma/tau [Clostridia bacterium]
MHQALYRKWRPQRFEDVCGQEHVTSILQYQTKTGGLSHAYLFCGSRGTGKTTCAKILAKAVNCENPQNGSPCLTCDACRSIEAGSATDVLEMDAASNNGVDNIRDIRDEVVYPPNVLKKRVYIIDEVHMLSASAFNALLKTLEEPPEYVVFILATTELQKLPATIISRCQRYDFRRIATPVLADRLCYIAAQEGISLEREAAVLLGRMAQGGMRDAISLLELCAGTGAHISVQTVNETAGSTGRDSMMETVRAIAARDYDKLFSMIDAVVQSSKDIAIFWQDLIGLYREMLVLRTAKDAAAYLDLTDSELAAMQEVAKPFKSSTLLYHCSLLEQALLSMQRANAIKRIVAESTLVRMCDPELQTSPEALLARIAALEDKIAFGQVAPAATPAPQAVGADSIAARETTFQGAIHESSAQTASPAQSTPVGADSISAREPASPAPRIPKLKKTESTGEKRTLRPLRVWAQVLDKMTKANPLAAGFYYAAKAYSDEGGNVVLKFTSDFDIQMAQSYNAVPTLCSILSGLLNANVTQAQVKYECEGQSGAQNSVIDEILESAQDN